jgi:hypothetical protein
MHSIDLETFDAATADYNAAFLAEDRACRRAYAAEQQHDALARHVERGLCPAWRARRSLDIYAEVARKHRAIQRAAAARIDLLDRIASARQWERIQARKRARLARAAS